MGVRHGREYEEILADLTAAIAGIEDSYRFFEMEQADWESLDPEEQQGIMESLADDVFYALGEEPELAVGSGMVIYRSKFHAIEVALPGKEARIVRLV